MGRGYLDLIGLFPAIFFRINPLITVSDTRCSAPRTLYGKPNIPLNT